MAVREQEAETMSWRGADAEVRRLRTLAAVAMVVASVTIGFVLGRGSAWLVPFDAGTRSSGGLPGKQATSAKAPLPVKAEPVPPGPPAASPRESTAAAPPPAAPVPSAPPATSETSLHGSEPQKPVVPKWQPAGEEAATGAGGSASTPQPPNVKVINSGQGDLRQSDPRIAVAPASPKSDAPEKSAPESAGAGEPDHAGIAACEKRYSSFRRSDGTYQPYGGGARQRCPLLR
jgi:hypothetical protein